MAWQKVEISISEMGNTLIDEHKNLGTALVDLPTSTFVETLSRYDIVATDVEIEEVRAWMKEMLAEARRRLALERA